MGEGELSCSSGEKPSLLPSSSTVHTSCKTGFQTPDPPPPWNPYPTGLVFIVFYTSTPTRFLATLSPETSCEECKCSVLRKSDQPAFL